MRVRIWSKADMRKMVVIGLITLALATSSAPAFAAWGLPAPSWFHHSCASPGARFTNAAYCHARLARTTVGRTGHHHADATPADAKPKAQSQPNSWENQYNSYAGGNG